MNAPTEIIVGGMTGAAMVTALVAIAQAFGLPEGWSVRASYVAGLFVSVLYYLVPPGHPELTAAWFAQVLVTAILLSWTGSGIASHLANSKKVQQVKAVARATRKGKTKPTVVGSLPPPVIAITPQGTDIIQPGQDTQPLQAYPTAVEWTEPTPAPPPAGHREAK